MRKCEHCNTTLGDNAFFCPECGGATVPAEPAAQPEPVEQPEPAVQPEQPEPVELAEPAVQAEQEAYAAPEAAPSETAEQVPAGPAETPKKKKKAGKVIAIIAAAVLLLGAAAAALFILNSPKARFLRAQKQLFMSGNNSTSVERFLKGQATEITQFSTDAVIKVDVPDYKKNENLKNVSLTLQIDRDNDDFLLGALLDYNGSSVVAATAELNEERVGLYAPKLADEHYTVSNKTIKALIAADRGSSLALKYDRVDNLEKAYKDIEKRYGKILKGVFDNSDFTAERDSLTFEMLDGTVKGCTVITYKPDRERVGEMLTALRKELKGDKELSDYLLSLAAHYYGAGVVDLIAAEAGNREGADNGLVGAFDELADTLKEHKDDIQSWLRESRFRIKCVLKGGKVIAEYIIYEDTVIGIEKYGDSFCFFEKEDKETVYSILGDLTKKDGKYEGEITITGDSDTIMKIDVHDCDPAKRSAFFAAYGEYDITVSYEYSYPSYDYELDDYTWEKITKTQRYKVTVGAAEGGGTEHRLAIIDVGDDEFNGVTVSIVTTDKKSTVTAPDKQPTELTSVDEIGDAADKLYAEFAKILNNYKDDFLTDYYGTAYADPYGD